MPSVVIVATSASKLGDHATGAWLEEIAAPYRAFEAAGCDVTIASIQGGAVPIDAASTQGAFYTDACVAFSADGAAQAKLTDSARVADLVAAPGFGAAHSVLFLAGGHGTCVDFDDAALTAAVGAMVAAGKVVATVCHGALGLVPCAKPDGTPLVAGLAACGFTDAEEAAVGLAATVLFL